MTQPTEEELKNMSPEELAEMQKQQCIFCQIISGKISSRKIYEDEQCVAVLDINPANPGHVLVLPKEHYTIMPLMPDDIVAHIFKVCQKVSKAQIRGMGIEGTNIFAANGAAAGQKAPHFMIHVIPRKSGDGITAFGLVKNQVADEDQRKLQLAIRMKVNERLGITEKPEPFVAGKPEPEKVPAQVEQEQTDEAGHVGESEPEQESGGEDAEEDEPKPKKGFDLDKISDMFK